MLIDPKVLEATIAAALTNGWQVATHAIGDRGNALVLDAYAAALKAVPQARDPRLRIEHAQVVRKEDVPGLPRSGSSPRCSRRTPATTCAGPMPGSVPARVEGAYAWRWFMDAKVPLAFGSDFPVEIVNPFWGLYAAITRQDDQRESRGRLAPRSDPHARRGAPRLHLGLGLRGLRRGSPGHPPARVSAPTSPSWTAICSRSRRRRCSRPA